MTTIPSLYKINAASERKKERENMKREREMYTMIE
jgi:hypothetical protein